MNDMDYHVSSQLMGVSVGDQISVIYKLNEQIEIFYNLIYQIKMMSKCISIYVFYPKYKGDINFKYV